MEKLAAGLPERRAHAPTGPPEHVLAHLAPGTRSSHDEWWGSPLHTSVLAADAPHRDLRAALEEAQRLEGSALERALDALWDELHVPASARDAVRRGVAEDI